MPRDFQNYSILWSLQVTSKCCSWHWDWRCWQYLLRGDYLLKVFSICQPVSQDTMVSCISSCHKLRENIDKKLRQLFVTMTCAIRFRSPFSHLSKFIQSIETPLLFLVGRWFPFLLQCIVPPPGDWNQSETLQHSFAICVLAPNPWINTAGMERPANTPKWLRGCPLAARSIPCEKSLLRFSRHIFVSEDRRRLCSQVARRKIDALTT